MSQESKTLVPKRMADKEKEIVEKNYPREAEEDLKAQESNDSGTKGTEKNKQEILEQKQCEEEEDDLKARDDAIMNESGEPSNDSRTKETEEGQHAQDREEHQEEQHTHENQSHEVDDEQDHEILTPAEERTLLHAFGDIMVNRLTVPDHEEMVNIIINTLSRDVSDSQILKIIDRLTKRCRMGRNANKDSLSYGLVADDLEGELSLTLLDASWQAIEDNDVEEEKEDVKVELGDDGEDAKESDESAGSCEAAVDAHDNSSDTSNSTDENRFYIYRR